MDQLRQALGLNGQRIICAAGGGGKPACCFVWRKNYRSEGNKVRWPPHPKWPCRRNMERWIARLRRSLLKWTGTALWWREPPGKESKCRSAAGNLPPGIGAGGYRAAGGGRFQTAADENAP